MSDYGIFSSNEGHKERRTGKIRGAFSRMHRALNVRLDVGSRTGFTSSRPPPPWTSVFQFSLFLYDVCVALRNFYLLIKTGWSVIYPLCC